LNAGERLSPNNVRDLSANFSGVGERSGK